MPAPAEADQRLLRGRELGELLVRQLDIADREPPVERRDRIARQEPARRHRSAGRHQVDAHPARGRDPCARQVDGHRELLETRNRAREQGTHLVVVQLDGPGAPRRAPGCPRRRGSGGSSRDVGGSPRAGRPPGGRRTPPRRRRAEARRAARASGRRPPGARARGRPATGRVVVQLVEPQPDVPRRTRAAVEPAVDPRAQAPLERRVAGVRRQGRVVRVERREEPLGRAVSPSRARDADRAAAPGARARRPRSRRGRRRTRRHPRRTASVQIAGVASEIASSSSRTDSSSVAPQSACQRPSPDWRCGWTSPSASERRARSRTASVTWALPPSRRPSGSTVEQLGELQAPRVAPGPTFDEVGGGRSVPRVEPVGGQASVGVAQERERARVVLPEELEGRRGVAARWCRPVRARTCQHRRDGRRRVGALLRARDERCDVADLLLGELVAECGHRAAAVRDLLDDVVERRRRVVEVRVRPSRTSRPPRRCGSRRSRPPRTPARRLRRRRSRCRRSPSSSLREARPCPSRRRCRTRRATSASAPATRRSASVVRRIRVSVSAPRSRL